MQVKQLDHLNMSVINFDETVDWYARVFGFELVEKSTLNGRTWGVIKSGDALLCIYEWPDREMASVSTMGPGKHYGIAHYGLRITDAEAWEATMEREGVAVDDVVDWDYSKSWYLKDPTGYQIEVAFWNDDRIAF